MPRVVRRRRIAAPVRKIWDVVSDPHHLPRWWPRTARVENVKGAAASPGTLWTQVLQTKDGRGVRADYRCLGSTEDETIVFEQLVEGTPFERVLRSSKIEVQLAPDGEQTEVALSQEQKLRGLSRFGSPLMRRASGRILNEALAGLDDAIGEGPR
ncbi:MAG: SRPBCC family protein [Solirubrobacterales bacterium]